MNQRVAARVAWGSCAISAGFLVTAAIFVVLNSFSLDIFYGWEPAIGVTFPAVGALIAARQPRNRLGWLMCGIGLVAAMDLAVGTYVAWALSAQPHLPGLVWFGWVNEWLWIPPLGAVFTLLLLLFPDGRLPSPRWRTVAIAAIVAVISLAVGVAVHPGRLQTFPRLTNPLFGPGASISADLLAPIALPIALGCALASLAALLIRLRRAHGVERQQLKWFTFAGFVSLVEIVGAVRVDTHGGFSAALQFAAVSTLPVAMGVAILRYRLYEIDRIVSRTVSYAVVTGLLVAVYVVMVTVVTRFTPTSNALAVAGSTLAVAALFQPLRRRVQAGVDRRFNRSRYDAERTVEGFRHRLRNEVALDAVRADLLGVVRTTMQPAHASVWLAQSDGSR